MRLIGKDLLNLKFIKMFIEILSFYKKSDKLEKIENNKTLGEYLVEQKLSKYFIDYHLIPMVAAIWSMPFSKAKEMPIKFFLNLSSKLDINFKPCSFYKKNFLKT